MFLTKSWQSTQNNDPLIQISYKYYYGNSWEECGVSRAKGFIDALGFSTMDELARFLSANNIFDTFALDGWVQNYNSPEEKRLFMNGRNPKSVGQFTPPAINGQSAPAFDFKDSYEKFFQFLFSWLTGGSSPADRASFIAYWNEKASNPLANPYHLTTDNAPCLKSFKDLVDQFLGDQANRSKILTENHSRNLTIGEIALARQIYKNSIYYQRVKIHYGKYVFFQGKNSGMTPNGEIYMEKSAYQDDYSLVRQDETRGFFLHEMAHVWQYQKNILSVKRAAAGELIRHSFVYKESYKYLLEEGKKFTDFRIEQQAEIIEDYYLIVKHGHRASASMQNTGSWEDKIKLLEKTLAKFLVDPNNP